ncbi:hypothetical protein [Micromonospora inositola]|uniref:Uncharacterized protein n=1 Tax=Micromonospora inositola TaxID=47865 RepID=A0A1C5HH92_9ACTN|nr:hypothetical protein [Micromonospora inositola]SCG45283.1 hypothetical protein GA0070613_1321 [Micromonospora inositola]
MAQQQDRSRQQIAELERQEKDAEHARNFGDEAAEARTPEDRRAVAPRDAGGRPSNGRQF